MSEAKRILAINPGSISTKLSLYVGDEEVHSLNITHSTDELHQFPTVYDQETYRFSLIKELFLKPEAEEMEKFDAVIGRGGLLSPMDGGVYRVNTAMLDDLKSASYGEHACNLGAILAKRLADEQLKKGNPCEALIADPVVVDELMPEARLSGMPELERKSIFHALNQKSVGREVARELGEEYESLNLIIAHLGGGISVGAHMNGRVVDVNNALNGDGPFSPERSGGVPAWQLAELVLSDEYDPEEIEKMITGKGGMYAYAGTKDFRELVKRIDKGDDDALLIYKAMILQIGQEIAKHGATLEGQVDGIALTGGMAYSNELVEDLIQKVSYLAPVFVYPGEREMAALAGNALDALTGKQMIKEYEG